jgi:four helix bundle protein
LLFTLVLHHSVVEFAAIMHKFKELRVYQLAFEQANDIYKFSANFPNEEIFSLTSQIRRSSRSVCTNLAEAYRKRLYPAHVSLKLTDSDPENSETSVWIDFVETNKYLSAEMIQQLHQRTKGIGRLLGFMILHPEKFL